MQFQYKIAGVVVLYNPNESVIENVKSYAQQIDTLYVVDNSEEIPRGIVEQIKKIKKVVYISNGDNFGVAKALNIGAEKSMEQGFDLLLTMDQDSKATPNMVSKMLECIKGKDMSSVGLISPFHLHKKTLKIPKEEPCQEVLTVMTSGNLLSLNAYQKVGSFMEELFIDHVDHEYCLRLNLNGFRVIQANNAILYHCLGRISTCKLLFREINFVLHDPIRSYYKTRNGFYVANKYKKIYPEFYRRFLKLFIKDIVKIFLLKNDRLKNLRMIIRGYNDFRRGLLGSFGKTSKNAKKI